MNKDISENNSSDVKTKDKTILKNDEEKFSKQRIKTSSPFCSDISEPLACLNNINFLKNALCELPLNPCEQKFIATNVIPLLSVMEQISRTSVNLSTSVSILSTTTIVPPRTEELIETINFIYRLNNEAECIYDVLIKRINKVVCCPERKNKDS